MTIVRRECDDTLSGFIPNKYIQRAIIPVFWRYSINEEFFLVIRILGPKKTMKNWTDLQIKFTYLWSGEESFYSLFDCPKSDETGSHLLLFSDRTWLNG